MITRERIETLQSWGMNLMPAKDKKPLEKNYKWYANWTTEELLSAKRIALLHRPQKHGGEGKNFLTIDFDDPEFVASSFSSMFPDTFSIGKEDSRGGIRTTHLEYEIDPEDKPHRLPSYEKSIEALGSTCSIIAGEGRHVILDRQPRKLDKIEIENVLQLVKVINFLQHVVKNFPKKGNRDEFFLRLTGALAYTDLATDLKEKIIEKICDIVGDEEVRKRVKKVSYQERQLKNGENIAGIKSLCQITGLDPTSDLAKAYDELKPDKEQEKTKPQGLTTLTLDEFIERNYPPIKYYMYPILSDECLGMIFALPGVGKSLFAMELAWRCSQGLDFMDFKFTEGVEAPPVLYVEGEMSARQIQDRLTMMIDRDSNQIKDIKNFYIAVLKEQPKQTFQKLKTPEGRLNVELKADEIYKTTGKKPIIFLDNVRFLMGNFNEKEGQDWIDFVLWLATLRAKGYSTYFLHHAVNTGEKASGSGYQDSNLDVNIKLSKPDDNSKTDHDEDHFTQIQFEFKKMRENVIGQMKPFIMVVNKDNGQWSKFPVLNKTERKIKELLDSGKEAKDIINPNVEGMSKANVHKVINKLKGEKQDEVNRQTTNGQTKEIC